jgi:hypothetical protein
MIAIYDRASMAQALALDLDQNLRALLERRFAALNTIYGDLTDCTEWFIVQPGDCEADLEEELGFSPMVEPIDSTRFGTEGFRAYWDHLVRHDGWFELSITYGSTFATIILVEDADGVERELRRMCREFAA